MPLHLTLAAALLAVQVPPSGTIEGVVRGYEPTSGRTPGVCDRRGGVPR